MKPSKADKQEKLHKDLMEMDMGMEVEKEHDDLTGGDKKKKKMIVDAHLKEDKKYYTKLKKMEEHG
jgi:hypothetical protein